MPDILTRAAGLARLDAFLPRAGRAYAEGRNADRGPDAAPSTSALSPFLRRRLITEEEVVAAALAAHGEGAGKFVEEVFWRTYFKGHLETRPQVWEDYLARVEEGRGRLAVNAGLRRAFAEAVEGRTGIEGFDDWAVELTSRHWLHNHARMWFASIWVFTLRLPWALGAAHFLEQLVDGDPASNTLSWRWVAGLHTRGKHYVARAENIRRHTGGRYDPRGLDEHPEPLDEPDPGPARSLPPPAPPPAGEVALLLHLDDLHPESLDLDPARVARVGGLVASPPGAAPAVRAADEAAVADALARAAAHFGCGAARVEAGDGAWDAASWAGGLPVVAPYAPLGPSAAALPAGPRVLRGWDARAWPRCTKGYFHVRQGIPRLLDAVR